MKWVFILDDVHYARCLSDNLYDLADLENSLPDVHAEMTKGKFSFLKSNRQFSQMATNQVYEQSIKIIKCVDGGCDLLK